MVHFEKFAGWGNRSDYMSMSSGDAKLMRAIGHELLGRVMPELQTADARERVAFVKFVLDCFASDLDVLPELAANGALRLMAALEQAITLLPEEFPGGSSNYRQTLDEIASRKGSAPAQEISALRALSARLIRALADFSPLQMTQQKKDTISNCRSLLCLADCIWLEDFESAQRHKAQPGRSAESGGVARAETVTPETLTNYLRSRFPGAPDITARSVTVVPGGRSKRTILVALEGGQGLPDEVVMRQDMYLERNGTTIRDEYEPLKHFSELGMPVPRPVHFEAEPSELGPPFLFVERIVGETPGSYFGMDIACPKAFRDLAAVLARLHRIEPKSAGVLRDPAGGTHGQMDNRIEEYWSLWRRNSIWPSPVIESAYSWARSECAATLGTIALVHGDCGPHNLLVHDGELTGLLDWEFLHIGDPAEDLGIARVYAESTIPWKEFIDIYKAAGGVDVPERRVRLAVVLHYLKGSALVAVSGRNFADGATDDFVKGANSYTGLRRIEMKIVEFFNQLPIS